MNVNDLLTKLIENNKEDTDRRLDKIDSHLEEYNKQLQIHIKGVEVNCERLELEKEARIEKNRSHEDRIFLVEERSKDHKENIEDIKRRAITPKRIVKWASSIGIICGAIYSVYRLINIK